MQNQKTKMYLQLAENNLSAKVFNVRGYKRSPRVQAHTRRYPSRLNDGQEEINPYIFIPDFEAGTGGIYVREDKFDYMPADQYKLFMAMLAPYQPAQGMDELSNKANRERRREQRAKKREGKEARKQQKQDRRDSRTHSKNDARAKKSEGGGDGEGGAGSGILDRIKSGVSKFINKGQDGGDGAPAPEETPFYKKPLVIGIAAAVVIGGVYMATKKK